MTFPVQLARLSHADRQVFEIFADELQAVRRELSKKAFSLEPTYPYYAGQAHWAMSLVRRIQMPMEVRGRGCEIYTTQVKNVSIGAN